jgi:tetratricopeptide (TPR) repeat protein
MARRVNTKFVVMLSVALGAAASVVVGVVGYRMLERRNPDVYRRRAEAALQAGDLKAAASNFQTEARLAARRHRPGIDAIYAQAGDLNMKVARDAQTQEDAVQFYQNAMDCYRAALGENPRNKVVNETLMEEDYQNALYFPSVQAWKELESISTKFIANNGDAAKARLYRAEARLEVARNSTAAATPQAVADLGEDLAAAQKLEPHSGKAVALRAGLMSLEANLALGHRQFSRNGEQLADEDYLRDMVAVRQVLANCLEGKWEGLSETPGWAWLSRISINNPHPDVAATLASAMLEQYRFSGGRDRSRLDTAIVLMDAAFAADPTKTGLADTLRVLYVGASRPEKAEALCKQIIKQAPEKPEGYFRLAAHYRERGEPAKAIEAYQEVTKHAQIGAGREAVRNAAYQMEAVEGIAWLNLELAEKPGTSTEERSAYLKIATENTEKLRTMHAQGGMVNLLEGRAFLAKRDFSRAVNLLHRAEANLNGAPGLADRYRQAKLTLARAYEQQNQLGAALEKVNEALELRPGDLATLLNKGKLLLQLGKFSDATMLAERILGGAEEGHFANEGALPPAVVQMAKSMLVIANSPQNPNAIDPLKGTLQWALIQMNQEHYEEAAVAAEELLQKPDLSNDEGVRSYQVAIVSNARLKHTDKAKDLAAKALQKYPENTNFQVLKAQLDKPERADSFEGQKEIMGAITDEYTRTLAMASLLHSQALFLQSQKREGESQKLWDEELALLQKAREGYRSVSAPEERERLSIILDRMFVAGIVAAGYNKGAKQEEYWKLAQMVVTEIEKLNLDGTDGKIYRGRLEMARTEGKSGLQYLQQAVEQRPDYSYAHQVLGQAYYSLGMASADKGGAVVTAHYNSALEEFRQVVRLAPNNLVGLQYAIDLLVKKADSASRKEAQGLLEMAMAQAPHNTRFIPYQEILLANNDTAINSRKALLESQPNDRDNLRRLAGLYVGKKDKETLPDKKQEAIDNAIKLLESDYQKHKDDLNAGDLLARILVDYDKTDKGAARALEIYGTFVASADSAVRFNALIDKAEFLRNLRLTSAAISALKAAKLIQRDDLREEAAEVLKQAIKDEPSTQDDAERHLADMYFDLGRMAEAEKIYLGVLENPKSPDESSRVTRRLIEAELRQAKYQEAGPRLEALLKKYPQDIQGLILRAYASIQQGMGQPLDVQQKALNQALTDLNRVLKIDSENGDVLYYRATAQMMLGDRFDQAEQDLIKASKSERPGVNARLLLAELYVRTQRYEEASAEYSEIIRQRSDLLAVRVEYANLLKDLAELQLTLPKDSDVDFVKALFRLDPLRKFMDQVTSASQDFPSARWWFLYAQGLTMQNRDAEALARFKGLYDDLLKNNIIDAQITDAYLAALLKDKNYAEVVKLSSSIIDTNTQFITDNPQYVSFFLKRAAAYQGLGKPAEAMADVDRGFAVGVAAAKKSGNYAPFIAVLNEASTPRYSGAESPGVTQPKAILSPELVAERLRLRVAADSAETISKLGLIQIYLIINQPAEALKIVDTLDAAEKEPALRVLILRQSALVRSQTKQYAAAEKDYKELDRLLPNNPDILNNYAFMLADGMKRPKEAIEHAEKALKVLATRSNPGTVTSISANVYDTLGWAHFVNNDLPKAEANLRTALKVQPQSAAYLHLALTLQKRGMVAEALTNCTEGIKMATARRDVETLAALNELQKKLKP